MTSTRRHTKVSATTADRMSNAFPCSSTGRSEDRFDDRHVIDGVLQRHGLLPSFSDCQRKQIALYCVLIADREFQDLDSLAEQAGSVVDKDPAGPFWRSVERDLNLNPATSSDDLDPLVGCGLGAARPNGVPALYILAINAASCEIH